MQFILKDNFIYVVNSTGLANNIVEADVIIKYVPAFETAKLSYSVNNSPFIPLKDEKIRFTVNDLKKPHIDLVVKAITDEGVLLYKSETLPVTYAIMVGGDMEDAYPERLKQLEKRLDRTHKLIEETVGYIEEVEKRGRLL